jgi:hypothetical protein
VFNLEFIDNPASYWAVIMPLFLSVDMLNDSFTLHALKSVKQNLYKQGVRAKHEESKANGTLERDLLVAAAKRFNAGADNNRREIRPPAGFEELGPRLFVEDSQGSTAATMLFEFTLPGVTPGQAFTFDNRYSMEEKKTGTEKILQVFSKKHRVSHAKPLPSLTDFVVSRRDFVADCVWKRLDLDDGSKMFLSVNQSKRARGSLQGDRTH